MHGLETLAEGARALVVVPVEAVGEAHAASALSAVMKYQLFRPFLMSARTVVLASEQVSYIQCTLCAVHWSSLMVEAAAPVTIASFFFSSASSSGQSMRARFHGGVTNFRANARARARCAGVTVQEQQ